MPPQLAPLTGRLCTTPFHATVWLHTTPTPWRAACAQAFAEELLPGLDIIPTATIAWVLENTEFGQNFNSAADTPSASARPPSAQEGGMKSAAGEVINDDISR